MNFEELLLYENLQEHLMNIILFLSIFRVDSISIQLLICKALKSSLNSKIRDFFTKIKIYNKINNFLSKNYNMVSKGKCTLSWIEKTENNNIVSKGKFIWNEINAFKQTDSSSFSIHLKRQAFQSKRNFSNLNSEKSLFG